MSSNGGGGGGGGFRGRMEHYLYSGEKKHVMAGIAIISLVFGIPWVLMTRGSCSFHSLYPCYSFDFFFFSSTDFLVLVAIVNGGLLLCMPNPKISDLLFCVFFKTCFIDPKRIKLRNLGQGRHDLRFFCSGFFVFLGLMLEFYF